MPKNCGGIPGGSLLLVLLLVQVSLIVAPTAWAAHPTIFDLFEDSDTQGARQESRQKDDHDSNLSAPELVARGRGAAERFIVERKPALLLEALRAFDTAMAVEPTHAPAYVEMAVAASELVGALPDTDARRKPLSDELKITLNRAEQLDPHLPTLFQARALVHYELGERTQAEEWARKSIDRHPELALAYWVLASIQARSEREAAIKTLQAGLTVAERPVDIWLLNMELSRTYGGTKRFDLQLESSQRALEVIPDTWWPLNNSARALVELGRYEEVVETARKALKLQNADWTRAYLAYALLSLSEIEAMQREINLIQDPEALTYLSIKLRLARRLEDARRLAEQAIRVTPDEIGPHAARGHALYDLGRRQEALVEYQTVVQLPAKHETDRIDQSDCSFYMGLTAYEEGRDQDAELLCRKALALTPNHKAANELQGNILAFRYHKHATAIPYYETAMARWPENANLYYSLGLCYRKTGRYQEGTALWHRYLAMRPTDEIAKFIRQHIDESQ
ncbi:MAG: tetratricopeptide repeat protein [Candidatus Omnitrophica bacterium]|nr:tetratricopeptide repeat protein [Candidatus Omnitrophota bacterium]